MCTGLAISTNDNFFFGRNLDLDYDFGQSVVITPRNYEFKFKKMNIIQTHYAMVGMATIVDNYPLYAEAINEKGLGMAGLNFVGYARYSTDVVEGKNNITPYEIIPWLLSQFSTVDECIPYLENLNMIDIPFKENMPCSPLHWILADKMRTIVIEVTDSGVDIYDNPVGVLTNNPRFDYHMTSLNKYMGVTAYNPANMFSSNLSLKPLGVGVGGLGLPGDSSPESRFVKTAFLRENFIPMPSDEANVSNFLNVLWNVVMVNGSVLGSPDEVHVTRYSCCCNTRTGDFYYKRYDKLEINKISMMEEDIDGNKLISKGY